MLLYFLLLFVSPYNVSSTLVEIFVVVQRAHKIVSGTFHKNCEMNT